MDFTLFSNCGGKGQRHIFGLFFGSELGKYNFYSFLLNAQATDFIFLTAKKIKTIDFIQHFVKHKNIIATSNHRSSWR